MSGLRVLIFEYDRPFADALERAFARRGCTVRVVDDGQIGLEVALDDRPGLIILAIELPRMNGFAVCNRIKKHPDLKDIPLVIVSSDSPPETFEQHSKLRTRAEDYAHKPIEPEVLIARAAAFVDIPPARDSEIMVDDEAIEEAADDAPIDLDDVSGLLTDPGFDSIVLESAPPAGSSARTPSAASLLEPPPDHLSDRPPNDGDDFEDFTMVSSNLELLPNLQEITRAVETMPPPLRPAALTPVPAPGPLTPAPLAAPLTPAPLTPASIAPASFAPAPLAPVSFAPAPRTPAPAHSSAAPLPRLDLASPPSAPPSAPPSPSPAEVDRLHRRIEELERDLSTSQGATQRVVALTEENQRLRAQGDELARLTRELDEARRAASASASTAMAAVAAPARPGGVSTREFLELRESLNRKDKDILARDKEILELRDKLLQAEMSAADVDDRLAEREHEAAAARYSGESLQAELQAEAARRAEAERALAASREAVSQGEAALRQQLADLELRLSRDAAAHQQELDALRGEVEASVAATAAAGASLASQASARDAAEGSLRAELASALASLRSEHAQVIDSMRADHAAAVESAKAEHAATAAALAAEASSRREAGDRASVLESELSASRSQNAALAAELSASHERGEAATRDLAAARERLSTLERRQASAEALLDRARQAMEIAAGLVHAATQDEPAVGVASTDA